MAVSYIGASNLIKTNGGAPGAITPHASSTTGDLLVFFHYSRATGGDETVTSPSGFTNVFNSVTANQGLVCVATRQYTSGTFTASITNHTSGTSGETVLEWIETYRGHDSAAPVVNYTASLSTWASSLNIGSIAAPGTATVHDGDMVVVLGGRFENITGQTTLTGDNLTWAQNTLCDSALGLDAGAVTQRGLNSSGSNQTVTAKTITTTGTAQVGAGRMFTIEKNTTQNYTLICDTVAFAETGVAATVKADRKIAAGVAAYSMTGLTVGLGKGYIMSAVTALFSLTGIAAGVAAGRKIAADSISYSMTGTAASVIFGRALTAATTAFSMVGTAVSFTWDRALNGAKVILEVASGGIQKKINNKVYLEL